MSSKGNEPQACGFFMLMVVSYPWHTSSNYSEWRSSSGGPWGDEPSEECSMVSDVNVGEQHSLGMESDAPLVHPERGLTEYGYPKYRLPGTIRIQSGQASSPWPSSRNSLSRVRRNRAVQEPRWLHQPAMQRCPGRVSSAIGKILQAGFCLSVEQLHCEDLRPFWSTEQ